MTAQPTEPNHRRGGQALEATPGSEIDQLRRANAELEVFAQKIAHDLREPLRSIRLLTQFLSEDLPNPDATTVQRLAKLGELAARAERLMAALLDFARVGELPLTLTDNNLSQVAGEAADTLAAAIAENRATVDISEALPVERCDRSLIGHVFVHLIANALKYNKSQHKRVQIGSLGRPEGPAIFVRDNGTGIAQRDLDAVLAMFTRRHSREDFELGAGAGLAICKRIVERHGGAIWLESDPGAGTTVYFRLKGATDVRSESPG